MQVCRWLFAILCIGSLLAVPVAQGQASGRIVTRTRLVALFSELQEQWFDAVKKKDAAGLNQLLADEYQVWSPAHEGPTPREDYEAQAFASQLKSYRIENMAVRAVRDDVSVESFVVSEVWMKQSQQAMERWFVVNVWTSEGGKWHCTDTYISPVTADARGREPVRPSGKN